MIYTAAAAADRQMNRTDARRDARRGRSRVALLGLLASAVAAVSIGCDEVGDQAAFNLQTEAAALRTEGRSVEGLTAAEEKLSKIGESDRSSPAIVQGQHAYGQFLLSKADLAAAALSEAEQQASATITRIASLLRAADAGRARSEVARALDPAERVTAANAFVTNVRGGSQPTFAVVGNDGPQLSTLAAAQQEKSRLDGEIAKTKESIGALTTQRDGILSQAGQVAAAMEAQNSSDRVASATRAAELRRQASLLSRQISDQSNALARLEADQALQTALAEQLSAGITAAEAQSKSLSEGWTAISATATQQSADAKAIIDGPGSLERPTVKFLIAGGGSGETTFDGLAKQIEEVKKQRDDVVAAYEKAIATLDKARNAAQTASAAYTTAKQNGEAFEGKAWDELIALLNVDRIGLDKAAAERGLADAKAGYAQLLTQLIVTSRQFDTVGGALRASALPPFDTASLTTELNTTLNEANEAYDAALTTIEGHSLTGKGVDGLKTSRSTAVVLTNYSRYLLSKLAEVGGAGGELPKAAKEHLDKATAAANEAVNEQNLTLPRLPADIKVEKKAPAPEPTETPAEGETPADGATPADGTTPADGETPPADGATPPGDGATPPGDAPTE